MPTSIVPASSGTPAPRRRGTGIVAAGMAAGLALAACSSSGTPAPTTATLGPSASPAASEVPSPSATRAGVVLVVTAEGGFINPSARLAALPTVVVYADGRIMTPGAPPAANPDPLVPSIDVRTVGDAGAAAIVTAIRAAGLDTPSTSDPGIAADAGTSVFAVTTPTGTVTTRFAANGPGGPGIPGQPAGDGSGDPERAAALALLARLVDPADTWGAASAPVSSYQPLGFRVFTAPGAPAGDGSTAVPSIAWPLAANLATFGTAAVPDRGVAGLRSGVVLGADAQVLAAALAAATPSTPVTSGGAAFTLWVRPLLPHELPG